MNEQGKNPERSRPTLAIAILFVVAASLHFLGGMGADPDLWAHVHYGGMILDGHGLPRVDVFSYSAPGAAFYDHEWLADLLLAGVWRLGGAVGLGAFKLLIGAVIVLALLDATRTLRRELLGDRPLEPLLSACLLVLVLAVMHPGATFRPQLFTMLLLALELALLARAERRLRHLQSMNLRGGGAAFVPALAPAGLIVPLLLVWANLHGGFLVGVGILCGWVGVATLRLLSSPGPRWGVVVMLAGIGVAGAIAPLVNPYGAELYIYLWRTLGMHEEISEWQPVTLGDTNFLRYQLLVVATGLAAALILRGVPRGRARTSLAWLVPLATIAALYGYRHQRHTVLFAEVAAPLLLVGAEQARGWVVGRWPVLVPRLGVRRLLVGGIAALALIQLASVTHRVQKEGLAVRFGRLDYPVDAVAFLERHGFHGNLAVPFEWGGYVINKMGERSRVFIDGRFEAVYPPAVIDDYFRFTSGVSGWERMIEAYPTDVVVVQRWRNIHPRLFARADLEYVYSDPAALVFVRRNAATAPLLARLAHAADRNDFPRYATVFP